MKVNIYIKKSIGKGKQYNDKGILIYEGEFIDGNKIEGKEYHENGMVKFEGLFLFNKPENGKFYNESGKLVKRYIRAVY